MQRMKAARLKERMGWGSPLLRSAQNQTNVSKLSESSGFDAAWEVDVFRRFWRELEAAA
jgi:hypothetical protein